MKDFVNQYFSLILSISCLIGFIVPNFGSFTLLAIPLLLAIVIFASFFQMDFTREVMAENLKKSLTFYLLRYILLPILVFFCFRAVSPFYASAFFLMLLLPSAVSSPAFSGIFRGNINLSITTVIISNSLVPLIIPAFCAQLFHNSHPINGLKMFQTLFLTIILPLILHFPVRRAKAVKQFFVDNNSIIAVFGISLVFVLAIAKYKIELVENVAFIPKFLAISFALYVLLYFAGWFLIPKNSRENKLTNSTSSGANNIGLGVAITILYFSPEINIFFIVAQFTWALTLIPVKIFFRKINNLP
jgi:predicted Na+-dependent transporter